MQQEKKPSFIMNLLNGAAIGIITALIPGAIFGELTKALTPFFPQLSAVSQLLNATNSLVGLAIGVAVSLLFKLTPIESGAVTIATMLSGGAIRFVEANMVLRGTGDIITMTVVAGLAVWTMLALRPRVKGYAVLILPSVSVLVLSTLGSFLLLPNFTYVTSLIGQGVAYLLTLEQTVMSILIAITFAIIIVSPISSVGIGLAIGISGVGSGAANLGICACMVSLALAGRRVNSLGICMTHVIGSPKISMPNIIAQPKLLLPIVTSAGLMGIVASVFSIQGTATSAGFGLSGLVGPVAYLNVTQQWTLPAILFTAGIFIGLPIVFGFLVDFVYVTMLKWIKPEEYKIQI